MKTSSSASASLIRAFLVVALGGSPTWLTTLLVWLGSRSDSSPDYWTVMPWFIMFSVPVSCVTALIALVVVMRFPFAKGTLSRNFACIVAFFFAITFAGVKYLSWSDQSRPEKQKLQEPETVLNIIGQHEGIQAEVGKIRSVAIEKMTTTANHSATYEVLLDSTPRVSAIVEVQRRPRQARYSISCFTTIPLSQRKPKEDPCSLEGTVKYRGEHTWVIPH